MSTIKRFALFSVALFSLALAGCASTGAKTGAYVDDTVITTKAKAAIVGEPNLKATEIHVETHEGTVELSGFVQNKEAAARAAAVVREVEGVKGVRNGLLLK